MRINIFEKSKEEKKDDTVHTKKWDRCVKDVEKKNKDNGTDYNPYAVCTDFIDLCKNNLKLKGIS